MSCLQYGKMRSVSCWSQPISNRCVARLALVVSTMWQDTLRHNHQDTLGNKKVLSLTSLGNYTPGAHSEVLGRVRVCPGLGFWPAGGWGAARVLQAHSLVVSLKHKSGNLQCGNRKSSGPVVLKNQPRSLKQRNLGWWGRGKRGSALYQVRWLVMCYRGWTSLKWKPRQSELKSGTCITKKERKTNC